MDIVYFFPRNGTCSIPVRRDQIAAIRPGLGDPGCECEVVLMSGAIISTGTPINAATHLWLKLKFGAIAEDVQEV